MLLSSFLFLVATLVAGGANETNSLMPAARDSREYVVQANEEAGMSEVDWREFFGFSEDSFRSMPWSGEQQQILLPYLARQTTPHSIMESEKAFGDWFKQRNVLSDQGVNFSITYTSDTVGNPVGGFRPGGCNYADVFVLACLLDTEKLFRWHGGYFTISTMELNGNNLSQNNIGNLFPVQQTYAVETIHFNELFYEQKFFDDKASLKLGRIVAGNEFAISPLNFLYMSSGINGNPEALWLNGKMSSYFNSVWGSRLKVELPHDMNARVGAYQVTPFTRNGLNWNFYPENGVMLLGQYGWSPEFFKTVSSPNESRTQRATPAQSTNNNNSLASPNHSPFQGLMGHYWMGGYYSTATYQQFNSSTPAANSYGLYWHADQLVYKPNPTNNTGLILWSDYVVCPQQNISQLPFQVNAGAIYTGLIPGREDDFTTLGVMYGSFSSNYASAQDQLGKGYPTYELAYESGYRIHLTNFSYIQPDLQWIIRPGGTGNIPNALVLGVEVGVVF